MKTCSWETKRDTHTEREAQRIIYIQEGNSYNNNNNNNNLSKGYKVTLYSDSLRAIALYAIYINGPNLGCPRGQCEYVNYTLVFDTLWAGRGAVAGVCVVWGSICLTVAALRLRKLYSQSSSVCAREWKMGQCILSVHSNTECPGLRQVVHCIACLNRFSSVVGRASWSEAMDILWGTIQA